MPGHGSPPRGTAPARPFRPGRSKGGMRHDGPQELRARPLLADQTGCTRSRAMTPENTVCRVDPDDANPAWVPLVFTGQAAMTGLVHRDAACKTGIPRLFGPCRFPCLCAPLCLASLRRQSFKLRTISGAKVKADILSPHPPNMAQGIENGNRPSDVEHSQTGKRSDSRAVHTVSCRALASATDMSRAGTGTIIEKARIILNSQPKDPNSFRHALRVSVP